MAVSSVSGSSSIYGNRNIISGLASGMDTESMIENAVSGIKLKVTNLQQDRTMVEWQQEAYRSIIDKMVNFSTSYTSYTSSTNLLSSTFFNSAAKTDSVGEFADLISASGKTSSDIKILGVKQLAAAASYTVSGIAGAGSENPVLSAGTLDLTKQMELSKVSGSLTIKYGGNRSYTIDFDKLDNVYKTADELAAAIDEKLGEQTMMLSDGTTVDANERIGVRVNSGGNIEFYDKGNAGNTVSVGSASGDIASTLGIRSGDTTIYTNAKKTVQRR